MVRALRVNNLNQDGDRTTVMDNQKSRSANPNSAFIGYVAISTCFGGSRGHGSAQFGSLWRNLEHRKPPTALAHGKTPTVLEHGKPPTVLVQWKPSTVLRQQNSMIRKSSTVLRHGNGTEFGGKFVTVTDASRRSTSLGMANEL